MCRIMYDVQRCAGCKKIVRFPEMCRIMYDSQGCAKCAKYCMIYRDVHDVQNSALFTGLSNVQNGVYTVQRCSRCAEWGVL
jgi:hypothetical protein